MQVVDMSECLYFMVIASQNVKNIGMTAYQVASVSCCVTNKESKTFANITP